MPENSRIDMVRAAKAILDSKLGDSGARIAWDALWSPEAKHAMLTRAVIELNGEVLGEVSSRVAKKLLVAREPVVRAAQEYLKSAHEVGDIVTDPDALEAIGEASRDSERIMEQSYRTASKAGEATGTTVSIFSKWAAEEHVARKQK